MTSPCSSPEDRRVYILQYWWRPGKSRTGQISGPWSCPSLPRRKFQQSDISINLHDIPTFQLSDLIKKNVRIGRSKLKPDFVETLMEQSPATIMLSWLSTVRPVGPWNWPLPSPDWLMVRMEQIMSKYIYHWSRSWRETVHQLWRPWCCGCESPRWECFHESWRPRSEDPPAGWQSRLGCQTCSLFFPPEWRQTQSSPGHHKYLTVTALAQLNLVVDDNDISICCCCDSFRSEHLSCSKSALELSVQIKERNTFVLVIRDSDLTLLDGVKSSKMLVQSALLTLVTTIPIGLCSWPGNLPLTPHLDMRTPELLNIWKPDLVSLSAGQTPPLPGHTDCWSPWRECRLCKWASLPGGSWTPPWPGPSLRSPGPGRHSPRPPSWSSRSGSWEVSCLVLTSGSSQPPPRRYCSSWTAAGKMIEIWRIILISSEIVLWSHQIPQTPFRGGLGETGDYEGTVLHVHLVDPDPDLVAALPGQGVDDVELPAGEPDDLELYEPGQGLGLDVEEGLDVTGDLGQTRPGRHLAPPVPSGESEEALLEHHSLPAPLSFYTHNILSGLSTQPVIVIGRVEEPGAIHYIN